MPITNRLLYQLSYVGHDQCSRRNWSAANSWVNEATLASSWGDTILRNLLSRQVFRSFAFSEKLLR